MSEASIYEAGKRSWFWLKWKEEYAEGIRETFDLVIVGMYYGRGKEKDHLELSSVRFLMKRNRYLKLLQKWELVLPRQMLKRLTVYSKAIL